METVFRVGLVTLGLYCYHDWKDRHIMTKLYKIEHIQETEMEIKRLRKYESEMREYHELCTKYWQFKILIGPPRVDFDLLSSKK